MLDLFFQHCRLNDIDLTALANKLKTKSEVNAHDLQVLKNILIQDEKNINLVLNTQGALRGLVREISGIGCCGKKSR